MTENTNNTDTFISETPIKVYIPQGTAKFTMSDTKNDLIKNTYYTHWNGGRPYKVVNDEKNKTLTLYKWRTRKFVGDENNKNNENTESNEDDEEDGDEEWVDVYDENGKEYKYETLFIGKSPLNKMTEYSGGYGTDFDGNAILMKVSANKYYYIGKFVKEFTTENEIKTFIAQVGNNDVPYPYCIDDKNNIYLLDDSIIIDNTNGIKDDEEPYRYYYDNVGNIKTTTIEMKIIDRAYNDEDDDD